MFGLEVGISEAVLEGDCQTVMQALKEGGSNLALVKPLILDALSQSSSFTKLLYSHTKRDGNKLAHSLARHFINVDNYVVWMKDVPTHLFSIFYFLLFRLETLIKVTEDQDAPITPKEIIFETVHPIYL